MAEQIRDGQGNTYQLKVNSDGSINTVVSGINIDIGSAIINLEDVYVVSGNTFVYSTNPTGSNYNPQTILVYSGTSIGSIYKNTSTGSIVKVLAYNGSGDLISVSAWVGV